NARLAGIAGSPLYREGTPVGFVVGLTFPAPPNEKTTAREDQAGSQDHLVEGAATADRRRSGSSRTASCGGDTRLRLVMSLEHGSEVLIRWEHGRDAVLHTARVQPVTFFATARAVRAATSRNLSRKRRGARRPRRDCKDRRRRRSLAGCSRNRRSCRS